MSKYKGLIESDAKRKIPALSWYGFESGFSPVAVNTVILLLVAFLFKENMSKYNALLSSWGDSAVSPANPLKDTYTIISDGTVSAGGITSISGYTIIGAESMEAALSIAKRCLFLDIGGSLEVSELGKH